MQIGQVVQSVVIDAAVAMILLQQPNIETNVPKLLIHTLPVFWTLLKRRLNLRHKTLSSDKTNLHSLLTNSVHKPWRLHGYCNRDIAMGLCGAMPPP